MNLLINNRLKHTLILFVLLFSSIISQSSDLEKFGDYGESILKTSTRFNNNDLLNYGITAGSTLLAYNFDEDVNSFFKKNKTPLLSPLYEFNKYSVYAVFATAGALYLQGSIYDNAKNKDLGLKLGSALIYSTLVNQALKMLTGRERPTISDDNSNFHFFRTAWDETSFPSGHSTAGFAFASVMAFSTDNDLEKVVYWSIAGLMAFERLYNRHHWLSDVVLGSAIGYFTGSLIGSKNSNDPATVTVPVFVINYRF